MKIVLPKSLAEPLTIPWKVISCGVSISDISMELHLLIDDFEHREVMPWRPNDSTKSVRAMLEGRARKAGAVSVGATAFPLIEKELVGHEYVVLFNLPNDAKIHFWSRKAWFPK